MLAQRRVARSGWVVACLVLTLAATGCTSDDSPDPDPTPDTKSSAVAAPATGEQMDLDVLVYNVEYGGNASTDNVIRTLDADIVGVLESYNRLPEIADRTGYPYYNVGLQILSKYPILEPSGADGMYALIEVQPGYGIAFFNTHLDYVAYGPQRLANGRSVEEVLASEQEVRMSSMDLLLPGLQATSSAGYPTFLTGDFNEPSSLDYAAAVVGKRPGVDDVVAWPVSEALFDIDFRDTFREINPDPVADPGLTHASVEGDRIDYVYVGGPVETTDSQLVGKSGDPNVDIGFPRWTSDHRAVLSSFELKPLELPTTVALDRRMLTEGDTFTVYYNAPGTGDVMVSTVTSGADPAEEDFETQAGTEPSGMMEFGTGDLAPGGYDVVLRDTTGNEIARNEFWVRSAKAEVQLTTDAATYGVGQPIEVTWDDGPANRWDWLGVYKADAADPNVDNYLLWGYTGDHDSGAIPPSVSGSMTIGESSQGQPWPLPPGAYVVHYLLSDQYESAGSAEFTVKR